jgi:hypothetical protein
VDPRAVLETVVKSKIPSPRRQSNPRSTVINSHRILRLRLLRREVGMNRNIELPYIVRGRVRNMYLLRYKYRSITESDVTARNALLK